MNRLWIPQTSTIVGLLGVGKSLDHFDELTKWIAIQLNTKLPDSSTSDLHHLELVPTEQNAAYAADRYARVTGKPGVGDVTVGAGANLLPAGFIEALNASIPMIGIVGDAG